MYFFLSSGNILQQSDELNASLSYRYKNMPIT